MILLGIFVGMLFPAEWLPWQRSLAKIATLPIVMGLGYEFIMLAGKHDNFLTRIMSAPGLWMQRITTKEPDEKQLAIAICAIKASMPEEFPDFDASEYAIDVEDNTDHIAFTGLKKSEKDALIEKLKRKRANAQNDENTDTEGDASEEDLNDLRALDGADQDEAQ
jgi:hypothetical protein